MCSASKILQWELLWNKKLFHTHKTGPCNLVGVSDEYPCTFYMKLHLLWASTVKKTKELWVHSFEMIWIRINDQKSLWAWCITESDESTLTKIHQFFDAAWSEWSWIIDPDSDYPIDMHCPITCCYHKFISLLSREGQHNKFLSTLKDTLFRNGHHFRILLFTCKLALVALFKGKYSLNFELS